MMKVSYLGPERTNSEKAARELCSRFADGYELIPAINIPSVAHSLTGSQGRADYGVMPYYNYLEGLVQQTLDLIYEKRLFISDVCRMPITHCLGAHPQNTRKDLIYSISVALGQCTDFIGTQYPQAQQIAVSSTAEGARIAAETKEGFAVSNREALDYYGLDIVADDIGNRRHGRSNFTDFYLVSAERSSEYIEGEEYFTMVAITPHVDRSGLLAQILQHVAFFGINNAKIHSRPAIDFVAIDIDPQMFYLEMMTHESSPAFRKCVDSLTFALTPEGRDVEVVRVLGSYRRPRRT